MRPHRSWRAEYDRRSHVIFRERHGHVFDTAEPLRRLHPEAVYVAGQVHANGGHVIVRQPA